MSREATTSTRPRSSSAGGRDSARTKPITERVQAQAISAAVAARVFAAPPSPLLWRSRTAAARGGSAVEK